MFRMGRIGLLVASFALVPIVALTTLGNRAQAASAEAFADRDFARAVAEAEKAERLAPVVGGAPGLLGRAQAAAGDRARGARPSGALPRSSPGTGACGSSSRR